MAICTEWSFGGILSILIKTVTHFARKFTTNGFSVLQTSSKHKKTNSEEKQAGMQSDAKTVSDIQEEGDIAYIQG